jgi:hypothetical protein
MRKSIALLTAVLTPAMAAAQTEATQETIEFEGGIWKGIAQEARVERYLGRDALSFLRGQLWLDGAEFSDGVIEFDVAYEEAQSFIGMMWRAENDGHYEDIYVRAHLNGKPDAFQYTPNENGLSAWQIFADGNAQTAVDEKYGAWNHVKLVAIGDAADIYFNSDEPVMHVPDLKTDIASGRLGVWGFSLGGKRSYFSNFTVRPLGKDDMLIGKAVETDPPPEGLISSWSVSSTFAEADVADALSLPKDMTEDLSWNSLAVETNGIANLAKLSAPAKDADTVFIRLNIKSDKKQVKELRFGYSDRVRIYLNGKRIYFGNAGWRVRDYRFLGTVGFFDSAGLDLKKGDNELLVAVSETFGGWAWAGAMEDRANVTLE